MEKNGSAIERALRLLDALARDDGATSASMLSARLNLPDSSARRMLATLVRAGLVERVGRGRYAGGARLQELASARDPQRRLAEQARGPLRRLARSLGGTAHLGMFDQDMVTYLVKEGASSIFTREQKQLEAYCTGLGKALLIQLPARQLDAYLRGPFVRLTAYTRTDPDELRRDLEDTRRRGYALDEREMADDIACVALPLKTGTATLAAISLSAHPAHLPPVQRVVRRLAACRDEIERRLSHGAAPQIHL
jgi:IclR family transcriptional regulator, acetate operon repressor